MHEFLLVFCVHCNQGMYAFIYHPRQLNSVLLLLKYLPALLENFGMHGATFLFAINSLIGAIFILVCLPETRGKSFEEIMRLLEG